VDDPQVLEAVDIQRANVVAAVSADDADNLVVASLARHQNGARKLARLLCWPAEAP